MPKLDNDLIIRFREKFGDLLLTCDGGESGGGVTDALHSKPPSHIKGVECLDATQLDKANLELPLGLASGSSLSCSFDAPGSLCPTAVSGKQIPLNRSIPGSGAVFHNGAGDLHSPMIQWEPTTAALFDAPIRRVPTSPWAETTPFVPLSQARHWSCEDTSYSLQPDYNVEFLAHHDASYISQGILDHVPSTNYITQQPNSILDSIISETKYTEDWHYGEEEKFLYNVVLEAPTAMHWRDKEQPMTYLNKGQTYSLRVSDSQPASKKARPVQYRTFVRVFFEEQDQRSDPAAPWQLWKEGRGLKEAFQRQSEPLAVEYVDIFQDPASCQTQPYIRLEKECVDGFSVTWIADPSTKSYEAIIALRFNFLSTDFTRSKGVKGVPVRLCVKTSVLRPKDGKATIEHDSEICYCVVKLFRDHGAERKLANDEALVKKKVAKLKKQIAEQYQLSGSVGLRHAYNPEYPFQPNRRHQSRKIFVKRRGSQTIDDLHLKLAQMNGVLTSVRQRTVLRSRGTEQDDPDLHPITLPRRTNTSSSTRPCLHQSRLQGNPQCPLEAQGVSVEASQSLSDLSVLSSKAVACFYVQVNHGGEMSSRSRYAIYLVERTFLDLRDKLAERIQTDPKRIAHIIWQNGNGLKILVDDDVVQHIPEGQVMTAELSELSKLEGISSSDKTSVVEVKLVF